MGKYFWLIGLFIGLLAINAAAKDALDADIFKTSNFLVQGDHVAIKGR